MREKDNRPDQKTSEPAGNVGYMRWLRDRKDGGSLRVHESPGPYVWIDDELDELVNGLFDSAASTLQRFNASTS